MQICSTAQRNATETIENQLLFWNNVHTSEILLFAECKLCSCLLFFITKISSEMLSAT